MMQLKFGFFLLLKTEAQLSGDVLKKPVLKNLMIFIEKYLQWCPILSRVVVLVLHPYQSTPLIRGVLRTQSNIYDETFLQK